MCNRAVRGCGRGGARQRWGNLGGPLPLLVDGWRDEDAPDAHVDKAAARGVELGHVGRRALGLRARGARPRSGGRKRPRDADGRPARFTGKGHRPVLSHRGRRLQGVQRFPVRQVLLRARVEQEAEGRVRAQRQLMLGTQAEDGVGGVLGSCGRRRGRRRRSRRRRVGRAPARPRRRRERFLRVGRVPARPLLRRLVSLGCRRTAGSASAGRTQDLRRPLVCRLSGALRGGGRGGSAPAGGPCRARGRLRHCDTLFRRRRFFYRYTTCGCSLVMKGGVQKHRVGRCTEVRNA